MESLKTPMAFFVLALVLAAGFSSSIQSHAVASRSMASRVSVSLNNRTWPVGYRLDRR
jgi:hypothetical protein